MARIVWANMTLSADANLVVVEPGVASWGISSLANKHTLAKDEIARFLRTHLAEYKGKKLAVETKADGETVASGTTFTSDGASFLTKKVTTSARLWITTGDDVGVYTFTGITATTLTGCSPAFTATSGDISYYIEADVLDLIKNTSVLTPAAVFLALHYCGLELSTQVGDFWDGRKEYYRGRFEETLKLVLPDLLIDDDEDQVISTQERKAGISGGKLLR